MILNKLFIESKSDQVIGIYCWENGTAKLQPAVLFTM